MSPSKGRGRPGRRKNIYGQGRSGSVAPSSSGPGPKRNQYAHILFALSVVAVLVFVFTRDETDPVEATTNTTDPAVTVTTETPAAVPDPAQPATTTATAEEAEAPTAATATTSLDAPDPDQPEAAFVDGLVEVRTVLAELVSEVSASNEAWDNRSETGARFEDTEAAFSGVVERTRALAESTRSLPVPADLVERHHGPQGPTERAAALVPLAEAILDGLRLPAPDDGSARREALADYVSASQVLTATIDDLIRHVREGAEDPDPAAAASPTTTTAATATAPTTKPAADLSDEALSYIDGLTSFKQAAADLAAEAGDANRAWDNSGETGVTYRETAAALEETINRARSFQEQVEDLAVPEAVVALGSGPGRHAARLATLAEAMLEGLRIPAPEDGSVRRAALADFEAAAEDFAASVDNLVAYIQENAESLGLVVGG